LCVLRRRERRRREERERGEDSQRHAGRLCERSKGWGGRGEAGGSRTVTPRRRIDMETNVVGLKYVEVE
jgi:hypothetical protein